MSTKICPICGRLHNASTKMCVKHYNQFKKYGKCLDTNPRNQYDPNTIRVLKDYAEIDTYDTNCNVNCTYKLDIENIPLLLNKKWRTVFKRNVPYLCTGHTIYFHRLVCKVDNGTIDHINRDTTDNRKVNLRCTDYSTQQLNQNVQSSNTEGITGVYYSKRHNNWHAELAFKKKRYFGPCTETKEESVFVRMLLEQLIFGQLLHELDYYSVYTEKLSTEKRTYLEKFVKNKFNKK